jgi:hypothetical protein
MKLMEIYRTCGGCAAGVYRFGFRKKAIKKDDASL